MPTPVDSAMGKAALVTSRWGSPEWGDFVALSKD
jgi:hypothetical protein